MKIVELTTKKVNEYSMKVLQPITNEECELLNQFDEEPKAKNSLSEREQILANQLTVKDVLLRTVEDGKIYYKKRID